MNATSEREKLGVRGLVRSVSIDISPGSRDTWVFDREGRLIESSHHHSSGREWTAPYHYDERGQLIDPKSNKEVRRHDDGSWTEIETLQAADNVSWGAVPGLPPTGFPTRGASKVETRYDPRGWPEESVFYDQAGNVATRVEYKTDDRCNIVEALQYSGVRPVLNLSWFSRLLLRRFDKEKYGAFLRPHSLESRSTFRYDDAGRLVETASYLGRDSLLSRITNIYNEHGDKLIQTNEHSQTGTTKWEFEYEYDSEGNWTRQILRGEKWSNETRRTITYFED